MILLLGLSRPSGSEVDRATFVFFGSLCAFEAKDRCPPVAFLAVCFVRAITLLRGLMSVEFGKECRAKNEIEEMDSLVTKFQQEVMQILAN